MLVALLQFAIIKVMKLVWNIFVFVTVKCQHLMLNPLAEKKASFAEAERQVGATHFDYVRSYFRVC